MVRDEAGGTEHRPVASERDCEIDRAADLGLRDHLGAGGRELIFRRHDGDMALLTQPGHEVLEQDTGLGLVRFEDETDSHDLVRITRP